MIQVLREMVRSLIVGVTLALAITILVLAPTWCIVAIAGAGYVLVVRPLLREMKRTAWWCRPTPSAPRPSRPAVRIDPAEPRDAVPSGYPGFRGSIRYVPFIEDAKPEYPDACAESEASAT